MAVVMPQATPVLEMRGMLRAVKAAVYERYGSPDVVTVREVAAPVPKDDEVLIRVHATTVTSGDCRVRSLNVPRGFGLMSRLVFGVSSPRQKILGTEAAGVVEAVGRAVTRFKVGDEVIAFSGMSMACHAELKCVKESAALIKKPAQMPWNEAAALSFGGTTALAFLQRTNVQRGDSVLINGASGAVGTALLQLAVHLGASVTAVCSQANHALVQSLGADKVIDYAREDFTQGRERYHVVLDTVGNVDHARCKHVLRDDGRLGLIAADLPAMLAGMWAGMTSKQRVLAGPAPERVEDLEQLAQLYVHGHYKPIIDRVFPFERIADAHRHVDIGRKRGNVVVTLA
jgi:NADPH:quinone reductase-like Zn-dependent oxidoreductase